MQVEPFHSVEFLALHYYHNHSRCESASSIRLAHTRSGTGNRPLCPRCAELIASERRATSAAS
jgi:hypothetical protein